MGAIKLTCNSCWDLGSRVFMRTASDIYKIFVKINIIRVMFCNNSNSNIQLNPNINYFRYSVIASRRNERCCVPAQWQLRQLPPCRCIIAGSREQTETQHEERWRSCLCKLFPAAALPPTNPTAEHEMRFWYNMTQMEWGSDGSGGSCRAVLNIYF